MLVPVLCLLCLGCCTVHSKPAVRLSDDIINDVNSMNDVLKPADVEEPTHQDDPVHLIDTSEGEIIALDGAPLLKASPENTETVNERPNPETQNDDSRIEDELRVMNENSNPVRAPPLFKTNAEYTDTVQGNSNPQRRSDDPFKERELSKPYGNSEPPKAAPLVKTVAENVGTVNEIPILQPLHSGDQHADTFESPSLSSQDLQEAEKNYLRSGSAEYYTTGGREREKGREYQQPFQSGDVEELVHGEKGHVHDTSADSGDVVINDDDVRVQPPSFGTFDVEHVLHGDVNPHVHPLENRADDGYKGEYEAGNLQRMVHGQDGNHVSNTGILYHAQVPAEPYRVGDDDLLGRVGPLNVHDPQSRNLMPSVGDLDWLTRSRNSGGEGDSEGSPTVGDTEHLMHGQGGHDHDIKQLKFLKTEEDDDTAAVDRFNDLHGLLMHGGDGDDYDDNERKIPLRKTITYKDIMNLGLDEESLKGVDLNKMLLDNAWDYDDWQRDKQTVRGESPEGSFWERVRQLRERYSDSERDVEATTEMIYSSTTNPDPEEEFWKTGSEWEGDGEEEEEEEYKDRE